MRVNSSGGSQNQQVQGPKMSQQTDAVSKNILNQIKNAQKQLQDLSSNKELSVDDKMKKRQEIQKQISDLNNQLRQHQIDMKKEEQQKMNSVQQENTKNTVSAAKGYSGMSSAGMQAMISADSAIDQAKVNGSVATKMEGRAKVLEMEIKIDGSRGNSGKAKQEELANVQKNAQNALSAQLNILGKANQELEESVKDKSDESKGIGNTDVKIYSEEGKAVEEEQEAAISVLV